MVSTEAEIEVRREAIRRAAAGLSAERVRVCECGEPTTTNRHRYCDACRAVKVRDQGVRPPREERGYGPEHRALRDEWVPIVAAGNVRCARKECGRLIAPGERWHLGHVDHDRTKWQGPEHEACNTATAGRRTGLVDPGKSSREW